MNSTRWRQVKEVLGATLDRHPSERPSFLADACGGDSDLRAEVESLLASHEDAGEFLDTPPSMSPIAARVACGEKHRRPTDAHCAWVGGVSEEVIWT